ncbi:putative TonB-dependent receptor [Flavihumibacter petaseus NBRC 106054]|uniref:Putative TonB-dependent receptor n=1 Tax=Flavihumibacter petaseus NBRC 106054 TaxID=1220578 RepID=A0A0E9N223_9BACT|nr:putative TonB-dependent receptor [Flavihumibacter petaseus NBRC 106054]
MLVLVTGYGVSAFAQQTVKGVIRDDKGKPLAGVTVSIKNGDGSTVSNSKGEYEIKAEGGSVLVFTYVGLAPQEVAVKGGSLPAVVLKQESAALGEVVVVGYGTQKRTAVTGAVSTIKGTELLKSPSTNISSLLGGRLPGITSVQESGEPGSDQAGLIIRGSRVGVTYIVDGIPRSINDIDPNDVESISVLKDGAAAAVYGLQAAGGVIIVTTKKGSGVKPTISYTGSTGVSVNANFPQFMNGPQFAHYYNMADMMDKLANGTITDKSQYVPIFTGADVEKMLNNDPTDGWDNVNYIDKVFGNGRNSRHSLSLQGAKDNVKYFASLGMQDQSGNIDNFNFKRYNLRTNVSAQVAKNVTFDLGVAGAVTSKQTPGYVAGGTDANSYLGEQGWFSIAKQTIGMHPYLPVQYEGLYTGVTPRNNSSIPNSPLAAIYESGYKKTSGVDIQTNIGLTYNLPWVPGMKLRAYGAYDAWTSRNKNLDEFYYTNAVRLPDGTSAHQFVKMLDAKSVTYNSLGEGQTNSRQLVGQGSLAYERKFGLHGVDALLLAEVRDSKSNSLSAYARDVMFPELPELGLSTPANSPNGGWSDRARSVGYVFRAKYDYANKYMAEFTGRYDGSYKFSGNVDGNRWGFFPSASLAWRITEERFMEKPSFLDDLKIRVSAGLLGNDNVSPYSYLSTYSFGSQLPLNGVLNNSMYTSVIANPNLSWEKTLSYNAGFDASFWKGKLTAEFDVFYTYTYDILMSMSAGYPPSMGGYYFTYENYGKTDSKGFELLLKYQHAVQLGGKALRFSVSPNVSYATARWIKYNDSPNSPEIQKVSGKKTGVISGWVADGLFRSEKEIDEAAWYGSRPNVGDIRYKDLNGDGKIDYQDRGLIGRPNRPELMYGLNLGASWNGFDINAQFTGGALFEVSLTGTYFNGYDDNTIWTQTFKEGANSPLFLVENAYSVDNPNGTFPRITLSSTTHGGDNGLASTFWFRNGTYVRLKSAQIGYSIPESMTRRIGVNRFRVFAEGSNIFTISGLPEGVDPESPRVNNGYYPQQKIFAAGVTLTF